MPQIDSNIQSITNRLFDSTLYHNHEVLDNPSPLVRGVRKYYIGSYEVSQQSEQSLCNFLFNKIGKQDCDELLNKIAQLAKELTQQYADNYTYATNNVQIKINRQTRTTARRLAFVCAKFKSFMEFNSYHGGIQLLEYINNFQKDNNEYNFNIAVSGILKILSNAITEEIIQSSSERLNNPNNPVLRTSELFSNCTIL